MWQRLKGGGREACQKTNKQTRANSDGTVDRKRRVKYENAEERGRRIRETQKRRWFFWNKVLAQQQHMIELIFRSTGILKSSRTTSFIFVGTCTYVYVWRNWHIGNKSKSMISQWKSHCLWVMEKLYLRKNFLMSNLFINEIKMGLMKVCEKSIW